VGTGAIGGTIAGGLLGAGREVVALSSNEGIAAAVRAHGFRRRFQDAHDTARGPIVTQPSELTGTFDWILLATPPDSVVEAAQGVAAHLAPGGAFVVMQNGLCEDRVAAAVDRDDAVLGAIVGFGASMPEPGLFERTSEGGFTLGRMDGGTEDPRLARLEALLAPVAPVEHATNFPGARWSKLAINCAISTLGTLAGARLGRVLRHQLARRLALEIMTEAVAVAHAEEVALEKVSGTLDLDWIALDPHERQRGSMTLVAKHTLLLAVGARYRNLRSSMLAALERGRTPPVDFINGEIATRGQALGIEVPVNTVASAMVHELARGESKPDFARIEELARRTERRHSSRPPLRA